MSTTATPPAAAPAKPAATSPSAPAKVAPPPAAPAQPPPTSDPSRSMEANLAKMAGEMLGQDSKAKVAQPANAAPATTPAAAATPAEPAKKAPSVFDKLKAPEAAKPAEPAVSPEDKLGELPDTASDVAKNGWKELKTIAKTERQLREAEAREKAQLKAELDLIKKATPATSAEIEQIKAEKKALEDRLAVLDLQNHPDFTKQYVEPRKKALAEADMLLKDSGITDGPDFTALLSKPRPEFAKAVSELAAKMNPMDQATFMHNMREAYRIQGEEKNALSKSGELHQQLQSKAAALQRQAFEDTFGKLGPADHLLTPLEIPETLSAEEKAELQGYNEEVSKIKSNAERLAFGRLDEKGVAAVASKAAMLDFIVNKAAPRMDREHRAALAHIDALTKELEALRGAKKSGSFNESTAAATGADTSKMSLEELARHHFRGGR